MATVRGFYVCAGRMKSRIREPLLTVDRYTNTPTHSAIISLAVTALWLFYFYGANVGGGWFGVFNFDSSELPVITVYALYIPIFIGFMRRHGKGDFKRGILLPVLSIMASVFIIFASVYAHGIRPYFKAKEIGEFSFPVLFYLIIFIMIMLIGVILKKVDEKKYGKESVGISEVNSSNNDMTSAD